MPDYPAFNYKNESPRIAAWTRLVGKRENGMPDDKQALSGSPISKAEMIEMFGSETPIEAVKLVFETSDDMRIGEIRSQLREIARQKRMTGETSRAE